MLKALAAYLVVAACVWFVVDPVRQLFLLPTMFTTATRWMLVGFLPFALATAWRYPDVGRSAVQDLGGEE